MPHRSLAVESLDADSGTTKTKPRKPKEPQTQPEKRQLFWFCLGFMATLILDSSDALCRLTMAELEVKEVWKDWMARAALQVQGPQ